LSFFDSAGVLRVALDDPKGDERRIPDLPLTPDLVMSSYYRPFKTRIERALTTKREELRGEAFRVAHLPELDMWVGLSETPPHPGGTVDQILAVDVGGREFIGPDGILVRLGTAWSDENMRLQPQEREAG
jgi:hypothetical protein